MCNCYRSVQNTQTTEQALALRKNEKTSSCSHLEKYGEITMMSLDDKKKQQAQLNFEFHEACKTGDIEKVKDLLENPERLVHANIHSDNDLGLRLATTFKQAIVIDYILSSPLYVPPSFHSKYSVIDKAQEQVLEYLMSQNKVNASIAPVAPQPVQ